MCKDKQKRFFLQGLNTILYRFLFFYCPLSAVCRPQPVPAPVHGVGIGSPTEGNRQRRAIRLHAGTWRLFPFLEAWMMKRSSYADATHINIYARESRKMWAIYFRNPRKSCTFAALFQAHP
jgi:hypothetical protein